jgi:O-antigen/teichoic acid export membrane protein
VLAGSDGARSAALAAVTLANHAIGVVFAVTFARLLGATDYGSLAALLSAFIILAIPGSALQVATAREATVSALGWGVVRGWTRTLAAACVGLAALGAVLREPLAGLLGVEEAWAAAALAPTLGLWLLVSVQRGALQGLGAHRQVGWSILAEGTGRLAVAAVLVLAGAGVTGAFVAAPLSLLLVVAGLAVALARLDAPGAGTAFRRAAGAPRLRELLDAARLPVVALTLLALLSNLDVILARHAVDGPDAGSYAAAALAAKTLVWVAIGVGLYLLPEATRLSAAGHDPRAALQRALAVVATLCAPLLAVFMLVPGPLLRLAFGTELAGAADQLRVLALAMALLAVACLAVQYMLALGRTAFLPVLGAVAAAEPLVLAQVDDLSGFATVVLALQSVAALSLLAISLRRPPEIATA